MEYIGTIISGKADDIIYLYENKGNYYICRNKEAFLKSSYGSQQRVKIVRVISHTLFTEEHYLPFFICEQEEIIKNRLESFTNVEHNPIYINLIKNLEGSEYYKEEVQKFIDVEKIELYDEINDLHNTIESELRMPVWGKMFAIVVAQCFNGDKKVYLQISYGDESGSMISYQEVTPEVYTLCKTGLLKDEYFSKFL